jgi:hypothetical protein
MGRELSFATLAFLGPQRRQWNMSGSTPPTKHFRESTFELRARGCGLKTVTARFCANWRTPLWLRYIWATPGRHSSKASGTLHRIFALPPHHA